MLKQNSRLAPCRVGRSNGNKNLETINMNFNNTLRNITAAVAFGAFGITMSPAAHATATYSANASVEITLLTDISGGILGQGGFVNYESFMTGQNATGGGQTNFTSFPGSPAIPMMTNDSLNQDQIAYGEASPTASSLLQSEGSITMTNNSTSMVDLIFAYSIQAAPSVGATGNALSEDALAESNIHIFDENSTFAAILRDLTANLNTGVTPLNESGNFTVQVAAGASNTLRALVDTHGNAAFVPDTSVPEPEALALLLAGLFLGFTVRRSVPAVSTKVISPEQSWG